MKEIMITISNIGDTKVMWGMTILLASILYICKYKKDSIVVIFSSSIAMIVTYSLKHLFKIPRPEHMLIVEDGYRFPSGHATMAAVVSTLIIYFTFKYIKDNKNINFAHKYLLVILAILWLIVVCYSRLYLGVHMVIDVIVGSVVGVVSTLVVVKISRHLRWFR